MNHIFAHVKTRSADGLFKVISGESIFASMILDDFDLVEYSPQHHIDQDSWFVINGFRGKEFCLDFLRGNFDSKDFNSIDKKMFSGIDFIVSVQNGVFYFQRITKTMFLERKIIYFGECASIQGSDRRLVLKEFPDAVYFPMEDKLIFKDLSCVSGIFKGMDVLFREATDDEVGRFLSESFIALKDGYCVKSVSTLNRKRISGVCDLLSKMSDDEKNDIISYIRGYVGDGLVYDDVSGRFLISKEVHLKNLLYGIQQRFYTTVFVGERRLANAIRTLS